MGLFSGITDALGLGGSGSSEFQSSVTPAQLTQGYNNTQTGLQQQQDLLKALQAQNGIANQSSVFGQQQDLANTLNTQAQGGGPNPALAQLNQQTGNNVANQAALLAGQRGAGANVGLAARQIGQQGAGIQQQAVGQEATLQAQQQLAAQQQLQAQQAQMANLASTQVGQQQGSTNAYQQGAQNQYGSMIGGNAQDNTARIANQGQENGILGGLLGGVSSALPGAIKGLGGLFGGAGGATAMAGGEAAGGAGLDAALMFASNGGEIEPHLQAMRSIYHPHLAQGGKVPVMVSPGEKYLPPKEAKAVAKGKEDPMKAGKTFGGKAAVKGDSPKNDTVKTELETGGVVIPRSVMQSPNPSQAAADFVAKHLREKQGDSGSNEHEDFQSALKTAISSRGRK